MVRYQIFDLNIVDVLFVAEFRELIGAAIPPIITLFSHSMPHVCRKGADTLAKLSEYGKILNFLI